MYLSGCEHVCVFMCTSPCACIKVQHQELLLRSYPFLLINQLISLLIYFQDRSLTDLELTK